MTRFVLLQAALLAVVAAACDAETPPIPEPPRPASYAEFEREAVEHIEAALARLAAEPESAQRWAELGMVYNSERQRSLAAECFAVAARLDPRQARWPYHQAVALWRLGQDEEAMAAMERSLALDASYAPTRVHIGNSLLARGDLARAEQAFRAATELDAANPGGWVGLARVALQRDQGEEAVRLLEPLLARDPEDGMVRQLLAVARHEVGATALASSADVLKGETELRHDPWQLETKAFQREPPMMQAHRLVAEGEFAEALSVLERVAEESSTDAGQLRVQALKGLGRIEEALAEAERALASRPDNIQLLVLRASLQERSGDDLGALETLQRLCRLQPDNGGAFAARGRKLASLGRAEEARGPLERAIQLGQADFEVRRAYAGTLLTTKRWEETRRVLAELVQERRDDADLWLEYALACARSRELDQAEQALAEARRSGASDEQVNRIRRIVKAARERREGAEDE